MTVDQKNWKEQLEHFKNYFNQTCVQDVIDEMITLTHHWLLNNDSVITDDFYINSQSAWWDVASEVEDEMHLFERYERLKIATYEQGILCLAINLNKAGLDYDIPDVALQNLASPITRDILITLLNEERDPSHLNLSMSTFKTYNNYSKTTNNDVVRNKRLIPLCSLGLLEATYNQSYAITTGRVAQKFFKGVFYPVVRDMPINKLSHLKLKRVV